MIDTQSGKNLTQQFNPPVGSFVAISPNGKTALFYRRMVKISTLSWTLLPLKLWDYLM